MAGNVPKPPRATEAEQLGEQATVRWAGPGRGVREPPEAWITLRNQGCALRAGAEAGAHDGTTEGERHRGRRDSVRKARRSPSPAPSARTCPGERGVAGLGGTKSSPPGEGTGS